MQTTCGSTSWGTMSNTSATICISPSLAPKALGSTRTEFLGWSSPKLRPHTTKPPSYWPCTHARSEGTVAVCLSRLRSARLCFPLTSYNPPKKKYFDGIGEGSSSNAFLTLKNLAMAALVGRTTSGNTPHDILFHYPNMKHRSTDVDGLGIVVQAKQKKIANHISHPCGVVRDKSECSRQMRDGSTQRLSVSTTYKQLPWNLIKRGSI